MVTLINLIGTFLVHALVVISITLSNCGYGDYSRTFYLQLQKISTKTSSYPKNFSSRLHRKLMCYFVVVNIIGLFIFLVEITLRCFISDFEQILASASDYLAYGMMLEILLQILYKIEFLLYHLQNLNSKFANLSVLKISYDKEEQKYLPVHIGELCKLHRQLCNMIQIINDAHGWQIVLLFCTIAVIALNTVYFEVIFTINADAEVTTTSNNFVNSLFLVEGILGLLFYCVRDI